MFPKSKQATFLMSGFAVQRGELIARSLPLIALQFNMNLICPAASDKTGDVEI